MFAGLPSLYDHNFKDLSDETVVKQCCISVLKAIPTLKINKSEA